MYKWEKPKDIYKHVHHHQDYDPKYPTFSSSLLDQINDSLKTHQEDDLTFFRDPQNTNQDKKMSSLRRACLVEKWMEKKVNEKIISKSSKPQTAPTATRTTLLDEFDIQDTLFYSSTTTTKTEYSVFLQKTSGRSRAHSHPPPRPDRVRTRPAIESTYLQNFDQQAPKSRANKIYSNLLKQPISPGARLSGFISSLFKEGKSSSSRSKKKEFTSSRSEQASTCSSASSFSRSCLSKNSSPKNSNGGDNNKRTVRFCLDEDSRPCGEKSNFARSISKRYQELRKLNGLERENQNNQKDLEEVALDLLSGYWDSKVNSNSNSKIANHSKTHVEEKMVNDGDYGANHGGNYDQHEGNYGSVGGNYDDGDYDEDDDDGLSCSSSDLFELDHLSLIGNELPVYKTTQFDSSYL